MSTSDQALDDREDWDICVPVLTVSKALIGGKGRTVDGAWGSVASVVSDMQSVVQLKGGDPYWHAAALLRRRSTDLILSSIFDGSDCDDCRTGSHTTAPWLFECLESHPRSVD